MADPTSDPATPDRPQNTYRDPRGWRQCRACHRERDRQRWITERNSRPAKPRPLPLNCSVCGRFVPARWPYVQTSGGGFTGDPLELVDARCTEHVPPGTAVVVREKRP